MSTVRVQHRRFQTAEVGERVRRWFLHPDAAEDQLLARFAYAVLFPPVAEHTHCDQTLGGIQQRRTPMAAVRTMIGYRRRSGAGRALDDTPATITGEDDVLGLLGDHRPAPCPVVVEVTEGVMREPPNRTRQSPQQGQARST